MNWQLALQSFSVGLGGIGLWFIYDLIKDFKDFKKETGRDISALKKEREDFKNTVRSAELSISYKVQDMQKVHGEFVLHTKGMHLETVRDLAQIKNVLVDSSKKADEIRSYLDKSLLLNKNFHERMKLMESEFKTIKIQIGDLLIIKDKKS